MNESLAGLEGRKGSGASWTVAWVMCSPTPASQAPGLPTRRSWDQGEAAPWAVLAVWSGGVPGASLALALRRAGGTGPPPQGGVGCSPPAPLPLGPPPHLAPRAKCAHGQPGSRCSLCHSQCPLPSQLRIPSTRNHRRGAYLIRSDARGGGGVAGQGHCVTDEETDKLRRPSFRLAAGHTLTRWSEAWPGPPSRPAAHLPTELIHPPPQRVRVAESGQCLLAHRPGGGGGAPTQEQAWHGALDGRSYCGGVSRHPQWGGRGHRALGPSLTPGSPQHW